MVEKTLNRRVTKCQKSCPKDLPLLGIIFGRDPIGIQPRNLFCNSPVLSFVGMNILGIQIRCETLFHPQHLRHILNSGKNPLGEKQRNVLHEWLPKGEIFNAFMHIIGLQAQAERDMQPWSCHFTVTFT